MRTLTKEEKERVEEAYEEFVYLKLPLVAGTLALGERQAFVGVVKQLLGELCDKDTTS